MPGQLRNTGGKLYLTIVNGTLAQKVDKTTPGAVLREYELPNKTKGSKWELSYAYWEGLITAIEFKEGDYGEQCYIHLPDAVIVLNTTTRYFTDFAKKVFSGNLKESFKFHPFDIEGENGHIKGISLQQNGVKLKNYFYDFETKKSLYDFPEPDETKKEKKTYWKIYFTEVTEFLIDKLKQIKFDNVKDSENPEGFNENAPVADDENYDYKNDLPFN